MTPTSDKVTLAVVDCLAFCYDSVAPRLLAMLFLDRLAHDPDWTKEEIGQVREYVLDRLGEAEQDGWDA